MFQIDHALALRTLLHVITPSVFLQQISKAYESKF